MDASLEVVRGRNAPMGCSSIGAAASVRAFELSCATPATTQDCNNTKCHNILPSHSLTHALPSTPLSLVLSLLATVLSAFNYRVDSSPAPSESWRRLQLRPRGHVRLSNPTSYPSFDLPLDLRLRATPSLAGTPRDVILSTTFARHVRRQQQLFVHKPRQHGRGSARPMAPCAAYCPDTHAVCLYLLRI